MKIENLNQLMKIEDMIHAKEYGVKDVVQEIITRNLENKRNKLAILRNETEEYLNNKIAEKILSWDGEGWIYVTSNNYCELSFAHKQNIINEVTKFGFIAKIIYDDAMAKVYIAKPTLWHRIQLFFT